MYLCKNKKSMRKISIGLVLAVIVLIASCSNTSEKEKVEAAPTNKFDNEGKVVTLNKAAFIELIMDFEKNPQNWVYKGQKPAVIDFYADWCRPCKMVAPIMEELANEYKGKINIYKVNVDNEKELAGLFNVQSIPAILFCPMDANPQIQAGAMSKEQYKQIFEELLLKATSDTTKSVN